MKENAIDGEPVSRIVNSIYGNWWDGEVTFAASRIKELRFEGCKAMYHCKKWYSQDVEFLAFVKKVLKS